MNNDFFNGLIFYSNSKLKGIIGRYGDKKWTDVLKKELEERKTRKEVFYWKKGAYYNNGRSYFFKKVKADRLVYLLIKYIDNKDFKLLLKMIFKVNKFNPKKIKSMLNIINEDVNLKKRINNL